MVDERQRRKAWGLPPTPAKALACVRSSALGVDLIEREAVEASRNFIRRRAIPKEAKPSMADLPERDAALLLDMLLAAGDALGLVEGLDEAAFFASRLHQNAAIRSLEVTGLGRHAGR